MGVFPQHKLNPGAPGWVALARSPFFQATLGIWAARPPTASTSVGAPFSVLRRAGRLSREGQHHQFAILKPRLGSPAAPSPSPSSRAIAPEGLQPVRASHTSHCCPARIDSLRCRWAVYSPAQANARPTLLLLANSELRLGVLVPYHAPRTGRGRGFWELLRTRCSRWHQSESVARAVRGGSSLVPFPERSARGKLELLKGLSVCPPPARLVNTLAH